MSLRLPPPKGLTSRHIGAHPVGRSPDLVLFLCLDELLYVLHSVY